MPRQASRRDRRAPLRHGGLAAGIPLHWKDDLDDITLEPTLIATPRFVLWPVVVAQGVVPADVAHILLAALNN